MSSFAANATAQVRRVYPPDDYFRAFGPYLDGDFATAGRYFARSTGRKTPAGESVDSIPAHTMVGECLYQMGDLKGALAQYNTAIGLFLRFPNWIQRIDLPATVGPSQKAVSRPPTWGRSTRNIRVARLADPLPALEGQTPAQNMQALQRGGVLTPQQFILVHYKEIVRCTALAIRRRSQILGAAAKYDDMTNQLIAALEARPARNRHWSQAWISCQLGLAYIAAGKFRDAQTELSASLLVGGMDHMLTPTALLELGKLAYRTQQFADAERLLMDATFSAAVLVRQDINAYDYDIIGEAFRGAMLAHRARRDQTPLAALIPAATWSHRDAYSVEARLLVTAAEDLAARGDAQRAAALLEQSGRVLSRREMGAGRIGARYQYVLAHTKYLLGDAANGSAALGRAMTFAHQSAIWPFQIAAADTAYTSGNLEQHRAAPLYEHVLRDPTPADWLTDPMESLAAMTTNSLPAYQHWLQVVIDRKEHDTALRISDQVRRRRFYATLPLGGRLVNLRWLAAAPVLALPDSARLLRQNLFAQHAEIATVIQQIEAVRAQVADMPPDSKDATLLKQRNILLQKLGQLGATAEAQLSAIALSPEPSAAVFPPAMTLQEIQQQLPPRHGIMSFITVPGHVYAYMLDQTKYQPWELHGAALLSSNIGKLLNEMGIYQRNQLLTTEALASDTWKTTAADLLSQITGKAPPEVWENFEEITIVPEGPLWYVPFEALQVVDGTEQQPLIDRVRIRYAPTLSLAIPDRRPRKRMAKTAVVVGRLFSSETDALAQKMLANLKTDDPNTFAVPFNPLPPSALNAPTLDRLVVMSDIAPDRASPYGWAPMAVDRGQPYSTLAQWMRLPWGGPDQMVLPGFRSAAENGLRSGGSGNELFLGACGLMATGTRTIVLSRWQEGGRSACDVIREFVRELPNRPASGAWQRAVMLVRANDLIYAEEPRVKTPDDDRPIKTDHPFFWANAVMIDRGVIPKN